MIFMTTDFCSAFLMLSICDILLTKIKENQDVTLINAVKKNIDQLSEMAIKNNSYLLQAQVLLLKAKFALIELKPEEAKELLNWAQSIAQNKGLIRVAQQISVEYDNLLEHLDTWKQMKQKEANLHERLSLSALDETIEALSRRRGEAVVVSPEEPVMLLIILREEGLTLYSKKFEAGAATSKFQYLLYGNLQTAP